MATEELGEQSIEDKIFEVAKELKLEIYIASETDKHAPRNVQTRNGSNIQIPANASTVSIRALLSGFKK